uniref:Uncharacterized protein n=1 Tax=Arundo donax TaxID=35708 RepID=A0A0A8Z1B0_ARUDO
MNKSNISLLENKISFTLTQIVVLKLRKQ